MKNKISFGERIRRETKHIGLLILDLAILVMCLVFVLSVAIAVTNFREYRKGLYYEVNSMHYRLEDGNYAKLAEMTWTNRVSGLADSQEYAEYYAVSDYYEAAVRYHICTETGDQAGAEKWSEKMTDAEGRMGTFAWEKEKIDKLLGIR